MNQIQSIEISFLGTTILQYVVENVIHNKRLTTSSKHFMNNIIITQSNTDFEKSKGKMQVKIFPHLNEKLVSVIWMQLWSFRLLTTFLHFSGDSDFSNGLCKIINRVNNYPV